MAQTTPQPHKLAAILAAIFIFVAPLNAIPLNICSDYRVLETLRYWLAPKMYITHVKLLVDENGQPRSTDYEKEQFGADGVGHCAYRYYFNDRYSESEFMVASVDGRIFVLLGGRNVSKNDMITRGKFID